MLSAECSCDRPRTDEFVLRAYYAGPSGVEEPSAGIFYQKYLAHRQASPQELQYATPHPDTDLIYKFSHVARRQV